MTEDGDTEDDKEARALLNKFLGASVLMSGMESMVPREITTIVGKPTSQKQVSFSGFFYLLYLELLSQLASKISFIHKTIDISKIRIRVLDKNI